MPVVVHGPGSASVASTLAADLDAQACTVEWKEFPDGESYARITRDVSGQDVVVVQSMYPADRFTHLMMLLNAARENHAASVTAVIPYLAYQRQDKLFLEGEAVSARWVAQCIGTQCDRVLALELHKPVIRQWFGVDALDLSADEPVAAALRQRDVDVVLAPDAGARERAERVARILGADHDFLEKTRLSGTEVRMKPKALDVTGRRVAVLDDIISTGGTMAKAIEQLKKGGCAAAYGVGVHGLFLGEAAAKLRAAGTDEILAGDSVESQYSQIHVGGVFAQALAATGVAKHQ